MADQNDRGADDPIDLTDGSVDDRRLATIRGLLAKAEATEFPEEAEAFFNKASELIARYAISEALIWASTSRGREHPDELRLDLDPQPGTDFHDAVRAAAVLRDILDELGMTGWPKTSGGRGLHIFVPIEPRWDFIGVRHAAIAIGREMSRRAPELVTVEWWKENRGQRIFLDYNQNARDRTIASAFSVRPRPLAPVSTPLTWDEVPETEPGDWTIATVPERIAELGDVHADRWGQAFDLTPALELYDGDEMPYPPDYPKMPGEPKRVQPSRARDD